MNPPTVGTNRVRPEPGAAPPPGRAASPASSAVARLVAGVGGRHARGAAHLAVHESGTAATD